jgi:Glycosyltransferase Family 4
VATALVISLSDLGSDPRVDRQIDFLRAEYRVVAAGFGPSAYDDVEFIELQRVALPRPVRRLKRLGALAKRILGAHERGYWSDPDHRRWRQLLGGLDVDLILVNDADMLPLALSVGNAVPVVFDAHEYSPTQFETRLLWRLLERPHVRWICRRYLNRVAGMMVVSEGIAASYEREFGVHGVVVTNAPRFEALAPSGIGKTIRLVHFGWPNPERRLGDTIDAVGLLDEHYSLDLFLKAGGSSHRHLEKLKERAAGDPRIRFPDPVPMRALPGVANAYDIGVFLLPPQHVHQEFTLPNKFFEYIQGRIVPAIGPSPEMARIIRQWDCGIVAADYTPAAFAAAITGTSPERLAQLKENVDRAARELCAERNRGIVLDVVARALAASSADEPSLPSEGGARASR